MAFLFPNKTLFSFLFFIIFTFSSIFPFIFSLPTVAISQTSNRTLICALDQQSFLNCSGFPELSLPANYPNVSYSGIVAGDGFLCGIRSFSSAANSTMLCWRFSNDSTILSYKRIYQGPLIREITASNSHICGLVNAGNNKSSLRCWQWKAFNDSIYQNFNFTRIAVGEGFICGLSELGRINCSGINNSRVPVKAPQGNYYIVAAGFRHACGITFENDLNCWGAMGGDKPQGKFKSVALGENRSCGLRINETVVCWGQGNFSLPPGLRESYFVSIETKRDVFCGVLKSNFSLICWGNENLNSNLPVFDEIMPGPCRNECPSGILAGSEKFCSQGSIICDYRVGNCIPIVPPVVPPSPSPSPSPSRPPRGSSSTGRSKWSSKMKAFLVVGCVGCSALLLAVAFFLFRHCTFRGCRVHDSGRLDETGAPLEEGRRPEQQQPPPPPQHQPVLEKRLSQLASMGNAGHLEEFSLQTLLDTTNNFSEDTRVGTGSFGSVYHGILEDGREIAIKRAESSKTSSYAVGTRRQEDKDNAFISELEALSRLHHKNLVRLLGFCDESKERVLVYEYMSNGTLHDHLHKLQNSPLVNWPARIKVALDAARGIEYLHEYAVPAIIHRDIKSSNILLDSSWTAKVSDLGLSLIGPEDEESHLSLRAAGTVGYMDPEYYRLQQLTAKSDVYSFGVVLLELLSGLKAIHKNENGVPRNVVDFTVPYIVQDEIHRILDKKAPPPTPFEIEAVAYVGYLAADCVTLEGRDRPSMTEIVNSLERALAACLVHPTSISRSTTGSST